MTKPCIDIETFTWSNLHADIYRDQHAYAMRLYLDSVVAPALDAIDARREELLRNDEPAVVFQSNDLEALRKITIQAFTLSVQSQWERNLREFLKACALELKYPPDIVEKLEKYKWPELLKQFQKLRGLPLQTFDSFPDLELLQLSGNACRHGDGVSARMLYKLRPELWPNWPPAMPEGWSGAAPPYVLSPPFSQVSFSRSLLERLTHAVIWFWEDLNYIYTNSIERKHSSVDGALAKMRETRARRPQ